MKTRNCFVSNSSSSSFLIAVNKKHTEVCSTCGRSDKNIFDSIKDHSYGDTSIECRGDRKDIIKHLKDRAKKYPSMKECCKKDIDLILNFYDPTSDWEYSVVSISYNADDLISDFDRLVDNGTIKVINDYNE